MKEGQTQRNDTEWMFKIFSALFLITWHFSLAFCNQPKGVRRCPTQSVGYTAKPNVCSHSHSPLAWLLIKNTELFRHARRKDLCAYNGCTVSPSDKTMHSLSNMLCCAFARGKKSIKSICHQLFSKLSIKQFEQHCNMSHNKINRKCWKHSFYILCSLLSKDHKKHKHST